jgi:trk system potassium uptake protein TrkA
MQRVCVIGLDWFGISLARSLVRKGCDVLAIDESEEKVAAVRDDVREAVAAPVRNGQVLDIYLAPSTDVVVVNLPDDMPTCIRYLARLRGLAVGNVVATVRAQSNNLFLHCMGATDIVFPEHDTAERVAQRIVDSDILSCLDVAD